MEQSKRTAIVYFSLTGNVDETARQIAERTGAALIRLVPEKPYPDTGFRKFFHGGKSAVLGELPALQPCSFRAEDYDRVILGTPVWAGTFTPPLRSFLRAHRDALRQKELHVFVCYSGGGAEKAIARLQAELGADFVSTLILTDPKDKPSEANRQKLEAFCRGLA